MRIVGFDVESFLIRGGCIVPTLVCLSWAEGNQEGLLDCADGVDFFEACLDDPTCILVAHNAPFDVAVCLRQRPSLLPKIIAAYEAGRIRCTLVRQKLIDISNGEHKYYWDSSGKLKKTTYDLKTLVLRHFGRYMAKGEDTWRLRYCELWGVPISEYPPDAASYAIRDAREALETFLSQNTDLELDEGEIYPGTLPDELPQVQAQFALHMMSAWGFRADPERVAKLREHAQEIRDKAYEKLLKYGLVRWQGKKNPKLSKNMKAIYAMVEEVYTAAGLDVPLTEKKKVSTDKETLEYFSQRAEDDDKKPVEGFYDERCEALLESSGNILTTWVPALEQACVRPSNPGYNVLVESGRTSCNQGGKDNPSVNCFDADTEILTKLGWFRFDRLPEGLPVAQWEDDKISFVEPTAYISRKVNENLVSIQSDFVDLMVTQDHRCLLEVRSKDGWRRGVIPAAKTTKLAGWRQINAGTYDGGVVHLSHSEVVLLCAVQADGSYHDNGINLGFRKQRKIDRLLEALDNLGVAYTNNPPTKNKQETRIRVSAGYDLRVVRWLGEDKKFGSWILDFDRDTLDDFCKEVFHWDGCVTRMSQYASALRSNADWVQAALVLSNKRANQRVYKPRPDSVEAEKRVLRVRRLSFQVDVSKRNASYLNFAKREEVPYDGYVYCVSVPSGFVVVRRNGKTMITGQCQNPPRKGGVRECIIARPGYVLAGCDYDTIELRTLAQCCLDILGHSALAIALQNGEDPHASYAAMRLGVEYDEFLRRMKEGDKESEGARQAAKPANFGFPGGLGPKTYVEYAKGYGQFLTLEEAKEAREFYMNRWPEMREYFRFIAAETENDAPLIHLGSGRVCGKVRYTKRANGYFQGRAADGAKAAMWALFKECYMGEDTVGDLGGKVSPLFGSRPILFLHDEFILEVPEVTAHLAAARLQKVMEFQMQKWIPDIPAKASALLMRRWFKGAKPAFLVVDGVKQMVPSKPQKIVGKDGKDKTLWVPDYPS